MGIVVLLKITNKTIVKTSLHTRIRRMKKVVFYTSDPIRLNLGCGEKMLKGYVNIDICSRGGVKPDIVCDIRDLSPLPADSVDEILAVHVIEHLYRWEVLGTIREWMRVLKPGGTMNIECPDILNACRRLLEEPMLTTEVGKRGRDSMWPIFGDPRHKDPYMTHHWGYSVHSLSALLRKAGLVDVRSEPAKFKAGPPRDIRVTAKKAV